MKDTIRVRDIMQTPKKEEITPYEDPVWFVGATITPQMLGEYNRLKREIARLESDSVKCWDCGRINCGGHY